MSTTNWSPKYQPATTAMAHIAGALLVSDKDELRLMFGALTLGGELPVKTLVFAAFAMLVDQFCYGIRPATKGSYGLGTGLRLSGIARDHSGLMTYPELLDLHDVLAEFPMSQRRAASFGRYLRERHGAALVTTGDCNCCIVPLSHASKYLARVADDENFQARLGCLGPVRSVSVLAFRNLTDHHDDEIALASGAHHVASLMLAADNLDPRHDPFAARQGHLVLRSGIAEATAR